MGDSATHAAAAGDVAEAALPEAVRAIRLWSGGWLAATVTAAAGLGVAFPDQLWPVLPALIAAAVPAAAGLAPGFVDTERRRGLMLVLWGLMGGVACVLTGGVAGPLEIRMSGTSLAEIKARGEPTEGLSFGPLQPLMLKGLTDPLPACAITPPEP